MAEITQEQCREILREHIKQNYGTQSEFARRCGVSPAYVSSVLLGKSSMPARWLELIGATVTMSRTVQRETGRYSFEISGDGFAGMSLSRVAEYMAALADLVGPTAMFDGMTANAIQFREGSANG